MYVHIWVADTGRGGGPREKTSSALFFKYNAQLGPPYQVLVDTNFINFAIKNKVALATPLHTPALLRFTQSLCRIRNKRAGTQYLATSRRRMTMCTCDAETWRSLAAKQCCYRCALA